MLRRFDYTTRVRNLGIPAWLAAVAACGQVQDSPPDAPVEPPIDAPAAAVKVTVLSQLADGAPDATSKVLFQDPAGAVVFEGPVDAMGKIEAMLPAGGTVTEVRILSDSATLLRADITTIMGVEPGDDLTFGLKARPTITNQGGQTSMSASFTPVAGATSHIFFTTCGSFSAGTTSPVTLTFRDSCHGPTFDLVGVATGTQLSTPRYIRLTNVNHENGQSFTIPGIFLSMSDFTVNALNVPAEISNLIVSRSSMLGHAAVATRTLSAGDPGAGTVSVPVPYPPLVGTRSEVVLQLSRAGALGTQLHEMHTAALASSVEVDLGRQQVPWLSAIMLSPTGVSWTEAVPGGAPDGMLTTWNGRWVIGNRTTAVTWRIAHPPSAAGISLPRLSTTHAAVDPQAQTVPVSPTSGTVTAVDYDVLVGYAPFRQQPQTLLFSPVDDMGAFEGLPFQRRRYSASVLAPPPPPPP